jgi:hypothetical protein
VTHKKFPPTYLLYMWKQIETHWSSLQRLVSFRRSISRDSTILLVHVFRILLTLSATQTRVFLSNLFLLFYFRRNKFFIATVRDFSYVQRHFLREARYPNRYSINRTSTAQYVNSRRRALTFFFSAPLTLLVRQLIIENDCVASLRLWPLSGTIFHCATS